MQATRAFRLTAFAGALLSAGPALAGTPALVVEADSGRVLYQERATDPWFPASVTKLMTAYVALREVREGRAKLDEIVTMSENAAAMPPSKMGFKPGIELTLDNALKIIMVKSANDVSVAIAETLGGTVDGFADMMNMTAQRLGMRESRFVNPHGLPDRRQQTSARDMAVLARAILRDFPEHHGLFSMSAIQFGRRVMANHNGLIGRYPGADGMKTGFICASGFNVVATATQNGRRLITVVMGSPSGNERSLKAAALFDRGFASGGGWGPGQRLEDLPTSTSLTPTDMSAVICNRRGPVPGEDDSPNQAPVTAEADNAAIGAFATLFTGSAAAQAPLELPKTLGPRAPLRPVAVWVGRTAPGATELAEGTEGTDSAKEAAKGAKAADAVKALSRTAGATPPANARAFAAEAAPAAAATPPGAIRAAKPGDAPKAEPARAKIGAINPKADATKPATKPAVAATAAKPAVKPVPKATADAKPAAPAKATAKPGPAKAEAAKPATAKAKVAKRRAADAKAETAGADAPGSDAARTAAAAD